MKRSEVTAAQAQVRRQMEGAGLVLEPEAHIEIADFGLGHFSQEGLGIVIRVNEPEYCSKWLVLVPGQECPFHYHKMKKETFFVLQGEVNLQMDEEEVVLRPGRSYTLRPGVGHSFRSVGGAVIEEVSTYDENSDSYFTNANILRDPMIDED